MLDKEKQTIEILMSDETKLVKPGFSSELSLLVSSERYIRSWFTNN